MKTAFIAAALIVLIGCSQRSQSRISPTMSREGEPLDVTVYVYRHRYEMDKNVINPDDYMDGQAVYYLNSNECYIHLIKSDDFMETLGHELMHCLYGDYH